MAIVSRIAQVVILWIFLENQSVENCQSAFFAVFQDLTTYIVVFFRAAIDIVYIFVNYFGKTNNFGCDFPQAKFFVNYY